MPLRRMGRLAPPWSPAVCATAVLALIVFGMLVRWPAAPVVDMDSSELDATLDSGV